MIVQIDMLNLMLDEPYMDYGGNYNGLHFAYQHPKKKNLKKIKGKKKKKKTKF